MRDGIGQMGAGQDDRRVAGSDMQHYSQPKGQQGPALPTRTGGPMKEALDKEMEQHSKGRTLRLQHLKSHYER